MSTSSDLSSIEDLYTVIIQLFIVKLITIIGSIITFHFTMAPLLLLLIIHPLSVCFHASINSYRSFLGRLTLPVISSTFSKAFPSCFILKSKYASIPLYYGPDNTPPGLTFEEETELIVKGLLQRVIANGIQGIDPAYLADNAHIISKGKLYEEAMKQLMLSTTNKDELAAMEELDRFLRGYISGERKARARMKIDYLIAGATSNRFEEAVGMLSEWLDSVYDGDDGCFVHYFNYFPVIVTNWTKNC